MPAEDIVTVYVDLASLASIPEVSSVGRLYQVGINGTGYMLADDPRGGPGYRRQAIPLDPQRLATSDTPFSEAIERYSFASSDSWTGGSGQYYLHRPDSAGTAFYSSRGVDPFAVPGELTLLPSTVEEIDSSYANLRVTVVGDRLFAQTGDAQVTYVDTPGGSETAVAVSGAGTITALASDGEYWYAADGSNIYRGGTSSGGAWSTQNAKDVIYAGGRICAAVVASGSAPNRFTTLNDSGAEERPSGHITLPAGTTITLGGETSAHVYFGAYKGNVGSVYAFPLGLDSSGNQGYPFQALELPGGLVPSAVGVGGGFVWVRAYRTEGSSAGQTVILKCIPDQTGALVATTVTELDSVGTSADHRVGGFAAHGDLVLWSWKGIASSIAGVGASDLVGGGWAKWLEAGVDGDVTSIDVWQGLPVFAVVGQGVYRQHATNYVTSGEIVTSIADGASALDKLWDEVVLVMAPLPTGGSVTVEYTLDRYGSFTSAGSASTTGATTKTLTLAVVAKTFGTKLTLAGSGTTTPTLVLAQTRYHPLGLRDTLVQITIDCGDQLKGLNGAPLPDNGPGNGATRARTLQGLVQQRVKYQDIDWHMIGVSEIYEVEACDVQASIAYEPSRSGQALRPLATLTMRKVG